MQKVSSVTKKYIVIPRNNVFLTIVQIHDPNFLTRKIKKIRTQKIDETANPCNFRIRESVKISL